MPTEKQLAGRSDAELAATDPLELNLAAAKGVPALAKLDVPYYKGLADGWAAELRQQLPAFEGRFWRTPREWDNDIHMYRLGVLCHFVHNDLGIRYREDQKFAHKVAYTDPGDLFLNGVMDTRRGTCGNMAALHVALGWRLGWPVSLALAHWHCILRFDDGRSVWNIEASNTEGGFRTNPDGYYQKEYNIPQGHIDCGSDLTFLRPRQLLGHFIGAGAGTGGICSTPGWPTDRHGAHRTSSGQEDFESALALFPQSRLFRRKVDDCNLWRRLHGNKRQGVRR